MLNQKGSVGTAELIIMMILLMALTFGGVDYWLVLNQFQQADHLKNQYLDDIRLNGHLEAGKQSELEGKLEKLGFKDIEVDVSDFKDNTLKYTEDNRASRKIAEDIDEIPEIKLTIAGAFKNKFWISNVLGSDEDENLPFKLEGTTYTEYVEKD